MSKLQLLAKLFLWFVFPAGRKEEKKNPLLTAESVRACSTLVSIPFFRASLLKRFTLSGFSVPRWAEVTVTWERKDRRANLLSSSQ